MKPRHAARELALLTLFQIAGKDAVEANLSEEFSRLNKMAMRELMTHALVTLEEEAKETLHNAVLEWQRASEVIINLENEAPENLARPIELENLPVKMPTTQEVLKTLDQCLQAAEWMHEALRIPKFIGWSRAEVVQTFAKRLVKAVCQHQIELDELLNTYLEDWRVERLAKMDRMILRMAVAEMKYFEDIDLSITINEAVELAKTFSSAESFKLINGVLGKLAQVFEGKVVVVSTEADALEREVSLDALSSGTPLAEGISHV